MNPSTSSGENGSGAPSWICVTPTRNESWIIRHFTGAALTWADHVIVADQGSTDGTMEMLQQTPGVTPVRNESKTFDELHRQRLLLENARRVPGRRILIGLDADEALSANAISSADWQRIENAKPGTVLRFRWVNVMAGFQEAWIPPEPTAFGYVDDGIEHTGRRIHSPRVPRPEGAPVLDLEDIVVLHFQYVLWDRMASKQRWYQAWEYETHREKGPLDIFRQYNHMHGGWGKDEMRPLKPEWLDGYVRAGVDFRTLKCEPVTWWDREVAALLLKHGPAHFRRIALWEKNWNEFARQIGMATADLDDPRSAWEKMVHRWLKQTQKRRGNLAVRGFEKLLRVTGW